MPDASSSANVEARLAIADLIHTYARHIRRDEPEAVAALFTPDAFFEIRDGHPDRLDHSVRTRLEGPAQINAHLAPGKGKPHPVPLIHNLIVEVDGDTAAANCVMEAQILGTALKVIGEYHDHFARLGGRWYFASRTYTIFTAASSV
jgi:SnoaL-like protein